MKNKNDMIDILFHVIFNFTKYAISRTVKLFLSLEKKNPYHKNSLWIRDTGLLMFKKNQKQGL